MNARRARNLARTLAAPLMAVAALAQTQVDLRTQSKSVDFSSIASTRPIQTGTTLPATCQTGQMFFKSDATAGQNLYACTATNVWTPQAGGSGGAGLPNCQVTRTQATMLTIFPAASVASPCIFGRGTTSSLITAPATVTSSSGTGQVYISVGAGGAIGVGAGSLGVSCSGCTATTATAFPPDSSPVWTWTLTSGSFDPNGGTDFRAVVGYKPSPAGGRGISVTAGDQDAIATDATVIPAKFSGSGAPGNVASSTLADTYVDTATGDFYVCNNTSAACNVVGAGQWVKVSPTPPTYSQWMTDLKPVVCDFSGTSVVLWDKPNASTPATFVCPNAGEKVAGYAQFANTGSPAGIVHFAVPRQWTTGAVNVYLEIFGGSGTGSARFTVESHCVGAGASVTEPFTWSTPANTSTANLTSATNIFEVSVSGLSMTECSGGSTQYLRITRDNGVGGNLPDFVGVLGAQAVFN
jgi:hypothetical protein